MENIFAVYKPKRPSSHDIVNQIRRATGIKKVGHAGTLDPLAKGVLVIAVGRTATKQLNAIQAKEKEYIADIKLGETSATYDAQGEKIPTGEIPLTSEQLKSKLAKFIGVVDQIPPKFSALKLGGKTAYKMALKGTDFVMQPRKVFIKNIELLEYAWPHLKLKVTCGPGTYIRSIANDLGGYLTDLERTKVGDYTLANAISMSNFEKPNPKPL